MYEDLLFLQRTREFDAKGFTQYFLDGMNRKKIETVICNVLDEAARDYCYSREQFVERVSKMLGIPKETVAYFASLESVNKTA